MELKRTFTQGPWEKQVGYCRAVRAGDHIHVAGTVSDKPGDAYSQAVRCLQIIKQSLADLDVPLSRVVRTRMFVADISLWSEFGRAHLEFFEAHPPATTMVEAKALIAPELLIEIEADAYSPK